MKPLFIATAVTLVLSLAASGWAQHAEAPLPPPTAPESPAAAAPARTEPAPQQAPSPRIDMPAARQGSTVEAAQPMPPPHRRPHHSRAAHAPPVNRALANAYTEELNRRELRALESADTLPTPPRAAPWRELSPPR
jgi:hypothetical protein